MLGQKANSRKAGVNWYRGSRAGKVARGSKCVFPNSERLSAVLFSAIFLFPLMHFEIVIDRCILFEAQ